MKILKNAMKGEFREDTLVGRALSLSLSLSLCLCLCLYVEGRCLLPCICVPLKSFWHCNPFWSALLCSVLICSVLLVPVLQVQ
jgi:hypothetical protein